MLRNIQIKTRLVLKLDGVPMHLVPEATDLEVYLENGKIHFYLHLFLTCNIRRQEIHLDNVSHQ